MADWTYYYTWTAIDSVNNSSTTWRNLTIDATAPMIIFTGSNPANNATWTTNNFTGQLQITEQGTGLKDFIYTFNGVPYSVYDSWLVAMYNFNNISLLWENSSLVKDMSHFNNTGMINWWSSYLSNWSYQFDWINDYISLTNWIAQFWTWDFTINIRLTLSKTWSEDRWLIYWQTNWLNVYIVNGGLMLW